MWRDTQKAVEHWRYQFWNGYNFAYISLFIRILVQMRSFSVFFLFRRRFAIRDTREFYRSVAFLETIVLVVNPYLSSIIIIAIKRTIQSEYINIHLSIQKLSRFVFFFFFS